MALSKEQEQELEQNGMGEGTIGRFWYDEMVRQGVSHKNAIRNFVDGLNNMQSKSFDQEQLKTFKQIITRVKGTMF